MKTFIQLTNLKCRILYNTFGTTGCCWRWKLDPYQITSAEYYDLSIDFSECNSDKITPLNKDCTVYVEPSGFFQHQIIKRNAGETIWRYVRNHSEKLYLSFVVNPLWNCISLLEDHTQTAGYLAFEYLGQIMPYVLLNHHIFTFHGVLMEHQGKGIIISAPSGTGKTTHARMWRDLKHALIINGDRATCYVNNGEWIGCGLPWSGTSGEQINRSVPLTAMVVLERGTENVAQPVTGLEAFGAILPHIQCPTWDSELTGKAMDLADDFLNHIPVIRLRCRPDAEAVDVLAQALEDL